MQIALHVVKDSLYHVHCIILYLFLIIMDKLQHKQDYWQNRKLYCVLQDDNVSCFYLLYFSIHSCLHYVNFNLIKNNISSEKTAITLQIKPDNICTNVYLVYLCEMTGAKKHIHRYMVLQCSKLFNSKVSSGFLLQDSQSLYSFGKIQNVGDPELSEEKIQFFIAERFHISFSHIFFRQFCFL